MDDTLNVHPFCDICGKELNDTEMLKNKEHENYEFPICEECFDDAYSKIVYIVNT